MIRFRHPIACAFLVLQTTGWISGALAAGCQRADASLAGHYYMRGVMEVGSELQLQANGEFKYMLAYGTLDEYATGCWSRAGQTVTLVVSKFEANAEDPMKFERLELAINPGGKLLRQFGDGHAGAYSR